MLLNGVVRRLSIVEFANQPRGPYDSFSVSAHSRRKRERMTAEHHGPWPHRLPVFQTKAVPSPPRALKGYYLLQAFRMMSTALDPWRNRPMGGCMTTGEGQSILLMLMLMSSVGWMQVQMHSPTHQRVCFGQCHDKCHSPSGSSPSCLQSAP